MRSAEQGPCSEPRAEQGKDSETWRCCVVWMGHATWDSLFLIETRQGRGCPESWLTSRPLSPSWVREDPGSWLRSSGWVAEGVPCLNQLESGRDRHTHQYISASSAQHSSRWSQGLWSRFAKVEAPRTQEWQHPASLLAQLSRCSGTKHLVCLNVFTHWFTNFSLRWCAPSQPEEIPLPSLHIREQVPSLNVCDVLWHLAQCLVTRKYLLNYCMLICQSCTYLTEARGK